MSSVLQPWVEKIGWKQQSILFSGLRGPDHALCPMIKRVSRWMRSVSQHNADPSKDYMAPAALPARTELEKELEHSPCHFVHHFADALRVIGVNHPDVNVKNYANGLHNYIAEELFHFEPETTDEFVRRHQDKTAHE